MYGVDGSWFQMMLVFNKIVVFSVCVNDILQPYIAMRSASTDKGEHNRHFSAPGRNCMTHHQALQDIPDTSKVSLHKNNKFNSTK
jgi:hypothetical protein